MPASMHAKDLQRTAAGEFDSCQCWKHTQCVFRWWSATLPLVQKREWNILICDCIFQITACFPIFLLPFQLPGREKISNKTNTVYRSNASATSLFYSVALHSLFTRWHFRWTSLCSVVSTLIQSHPRYLCPASTEQREAAELQCCSLMEHLGTERWRAAALQPDWAFPKIPNNYLLTDFMPL